MEISLGLLNKWSIFLQFGILAGLTGCNHSFFLLTSTLEINSLWSTCWTQPTFLFCQPTHTWKRCNDPLSLLVPQATPFTTFDHRTVSSLQLPLIYRRTVRPVSGSEADVTNHTNQFKQLELSLAINHHDTCYSANNKAALRREEGGRGWGSYSVALVNSVKDTHHACSHDVSKH